MGNSRQTRLWELRQFEGPRLQWVTSQKRPLEARALQPDIPTLGLLSRSLDLPGQLLWRTGAELSCVPYRMGFGAWDT